MAEIHAIVNGNWDDASTWDLNRVPAVDDDVYIGDYLVTITNVSRTLKSLNFNGTGRILKPGWNGVSTWICDVNITGQSSNYFGTNSYSGIDLTGNLTVNNSTLTARILNGSVNINGNIVMNGGVLTVGNSFTNIYINGNVTMSQLGRLTAQQTNPVAGLSLNGKLTIMGDSSQPYMLQGVGSNNRYIAEIESWSTYPPIGAVTGGSVTFPWNFGKITCHNSALCNSFGGYINFNDDVDVISIVPINGNNVINVYKKIKTSISNGLFGLETINIIYDDAEFLNDNPNANVYIYSRPQLDKIIPLQSNVKEGIVYNGGNWVGTYQQPPESVVLKGYRYDNDEKVGTLENEVTVTNTNTINVYPYKKRQ